MGSFINMNEVWAKLVVQAPGLIIALVILLGLYKLMRDFGLEFIKAQQDQAKSLASQATAMTGLTNSIGEFIMRDNGDHSEMRILMKFAVKGSETIKHTLGDLGKSINDLNVNVDELRQEVRDVKGGPDAD